MTKQPGPGYYETTAAVITTLYVALAVEFRLLRHRETSPELPEPGRERVTTLIGVGMLLLVFLLSALALAVALDALRTGSKTWKADLVQLGSSLLVAMFVLATCDAFFGLLGQALPQSIRRQRRPIFITIGLAIVALGIWLVAAS